MKKYHEAAFIVNGTSIEGAILVEGLKAPKGESAKIVNMANFLAAVANEQVQYFQLINGEAALSYTEEELHWLQKRKLPIFYEEDYYANDARINVEAFTSGKSNAIGISMVAYQTLMGVPIATMILASPSPFSKQELSYMKKSAKAGSTRIADNLYLFLGRPVELIKYLMSRSIPYSINFDTMLNFTNITYSIQRPLMQNCTPVEITEFANWCMQSGLSRNLL